MQTCTFACLLQCIEHELQSHLPAKAPNRRYASEGHALRVPSQHCLRDDAWRDEPLRAETLRSIIEGIGPKESLHGRARTNAQWGAWYCARAPLISASHTLFTLCRFAGASYSKLLAKSRGDGGAFVRMSATSPLACKRRQGPAAGFDAATIPGAVTLKAAYCTRARQ